MQKLLKIDHKIYFSWLAIFAGAILPLAFAPFGYYLVAEVALLLLLFIWFKASPGWAFWYGWLFGAAFFGCGIYWVYISIHHYGHAPAILAISILALLVAVLALYPALQGYLLNRIYLQDDWRKFLLAFPLSLAILEWIRGWFLSGFPWLFLGYGHIDSPLRGWATIFGVYGVSFAIAQTAGAIFCMFLYRKNKKVLIALMLLIAVLWGVGASIAKINWSKQIGEPVEVSLIQGNITQERKWRDEELWSIINSYAILTAKNFNSKIIVWPEAAIPTYPENVWLYLKLLSFVAKRNETTILSGTPFYDKQDERYYNGLMAFGASVGKYYKRHLVPFGEYMPLKFMLSWLHKFFTIPMSGFSSGSKNQQDLFAGKILLAPFICYEIAYPGLVLDYVPRAGLLVTVSDDSWFGNSIAAPQHLEVARMRSLEVERYQLLSTNTGISAIIDAKGKVIARAPVFQQAVLNAKIVAFLGSTPWVSYGQYVWLPLFLLGLWLARCRK
ncbi:MAG: apolipoprotein N-acyltransferase [Gammaproteobacteria bacterium RBG_16_37_9]|nr:MAG: apolipoprotein N-acyltransferase [Gammaproteobacteria bacterium RBG_16_37_9]